MQVLCTVARVGTDFSHAPGQVIEINPDELAGLLEAGHVKLLAEPEAAELPAGVELASVELPEIRPAGVLEVIEPEAKPEAKRRGRKRGG